MIRVIGVMISSRGNIAMNELDQLLSIDPDTVPDTISLYLACGRFFSLYRTGLLSESDHEKLWIFYENSVVPEMQKQYP